jgi:hypothetical protein
MMLGNGGADLIRQFAGQAAGGGTSRNVFWGEMVTKSMPRAVLGPIADQIQKTFVRRFAVSQGTSIIGRAIPFGIGAVIGGTGNHLMGRKVVNSARTAFGPPPASFPLAIDAVPKAPKAAKVPRRRRGVRAPAPLPPPAAHDLRPGPPPS